MRLLLAQHRHAADRGTGTYSAALDKALGEALDLLERLRVAAEPDRAGSLLEIGMLRALVHDALGDRMRATAALDRALANAPERDGYVRLFANEGAPLLALMAKAGSADSTRTQSGLAHPLSGRELEALRLLASELTGPDIARRLFVSVNTLRTHTKRIFTNLDVNNRAAAVRRARQVGLL